jgi:DNA-binding NtrC family response regulator
MANSSKILLIDDDKIILDTLAMILEEEGYIVDKAENGKDAIEKTRTNYYNLAIVDWRLPDIEGTKLLGQLQDTTPKMVKIMLTGYPSMNNAVEAVNYHADAFFSKPVDFDELFKKIRELLEEQEEARRYSEEKVSKFIESRCKEISNPPNIDPSK